MLMLDERHISFEVSVVFGVAQGGRNTRSGEVRIEMGSLTQLWVVVVC